MTSIWDYGFSGPDPNAIFTNPNLQGEARDTMLRDVVIINTPQLLFSVLYFIYNGIFTSMLSGT
jgi:hypothetical protein